MDDSCAQCGEALNRVHHRQKYCTTICKNEARKAQKREAHARSVGPEFPRKHGPKKRLTDEQRRENRLLAVRRCQVRKRYGMSLEEYEAMLAKTSGGCYVCGAQPNGRRHHIDHDHTTGKVRGLLCHGCNTGIGSLGDSLEGVERAVKYLRPEFAFEHGAGI